MVFFGNLLVHSHPLVLHLPHDLAGLFVFEFIEFVSVGFSSLTGLFFSLLFLLHDDFIADHFFEDDVVQDTA